MLHTIYPSVLFLLFSIIFETHPRWEYSSSSFISTAVGYPTIWICHNLSIHSVVNMVVSDGFTNISKVAMHSLIQLSRYPWANMALGCIARSGIAGSVQVMTTLAKVDRPFVKIPVAPRPQHLLLLTNYLLLAILLGA